MRRRRPGGGDLGMEDRKVRLALVLLPLSVCHHRGGNEPRSSELGLARNVLVGMTVRSDLPC